MAVLLLVNLILCHVRMKERKGGREEGRDSSKQVVFLLTQPPFPFLIGLDHHMSSVIKTREGEFSFPLSPASRQGSKEQGPNMGFSKHK